MPTYRLLKGHHDESIIEKRDPKTNEILREGVKKFYRQGEVFFSDNENLCNHNTPGDPKFEKLSDDNIVESVQPAEAPEVDLNSMTLAQLKTYAAEQGVDATGMKKADLIAALEEVLAVG